MDKAAITIGEVAGLLVTTKKVISKRLRDSLDLGWLETMRLIHGDEYYNNGNIDKSSLKRRDDVSIDAIWDFLSASANRVTLADVCCNFKCSSDLIHDRLRKHMNMGWKEAIRMIHPTRFPNCGNNHVVTSVDVVSEKQDVYDFEVADWHNFATSAGVFVHNSSLDEGIDIPSFNALIMSSAMKKYRRTIQRAGRGMRPKPGDNKVYIFDFVDSMHFKLWEHSTYRIKTYELEEYEFSSSIEETSKRMGIPFTLEDGLFRWKTIRVKG